MYIAAFITDTHLSKDNLPLNLDIFKQAIDICKKHQIRLYHGGDFLEKRGRFQEYDVKVGFEKILDLFKDEGIKLYGLNGNHDKLSYTSSDSWLSQFKYHPNFDLIDEYGYDDINGFRLHRVPFFEENVNYKDYLQKAKDNLSNSLKNVLLTHISVTGARNNDATQIENSLSIKDFEDFDLVLSGHYHQKQIIKHFHYFGSAYQANYGENEEKGITLLKEDGTLEFIKLNFPKYIKVKIDLSKSDKKEIETLSKKYSYSEDNINFEFIGDESLVKSIKKEKFNSLGIKTTTKIKEVEDTMEFEEDEVVCFTENSILDEFEEFCNTNDCDKEIGVKYINQIYEKRKHKG